jgi:hypothetical protein
MLRSALLAASLTVFLTASVNASPAANKAAPSASETGKPLNIGFVLYTKSDVPGTLSARWSYANVYSGPGMATGSPTSSGFVGHYHVRYFLENGQFSDEYDLEIQRHAPGNFYDVTWISDGKVSAKGVGMEVADGKSLAVGWRRITD